jgi:outer membrane protein insertion porin family
MPSKWRSTARVSAFFDIGSVFETGSKIKFFGPDGATPADYRFHPGDLKRSVGIAVQWLAPLGLFRFSLGVPLNAHKGNDPTTCTAAHCSWGDETETFQFSIGQAF